MAITDAQKLDFLFKKLGFGATKTDTNALKAAVNEEIPSPLLLSGKDLWTQAADIPSSIPDVNTDIVALYKDAFGGSDTVECTALGTASTNRSWSTGLTNWIPTQFGSSYQVKVYIAAAGAGSPESGTQLFAAGSGNNDEWFFDYQSGVLNFIGTNLPSGIGSNKIFIAGARYTGKLGNNFKTIYIDSGEVEHINIDSTDITMADIITAYIDSADVMHAIIDSADITLGRISTVQATNLTADSAHIKSLSADSISLSALTSNIITANQIQGPANLVIDPATVGDNTGLVQILGNLQVEGTTTTINSTTVSLNDKNLVLADSAANAAAADGAGLTVKLDQSGSVATILYKASGDNWEVNRNWHAPLLNADSADIGLLRSDSAVITNVEATNLTADSARLKIFQLDSGSIGKINSIDSGHATNFTVTNLTGTNVDMDSASFNTVTASNFGIAGTSPNRILTANASNIVGTSIDFVANASQVNFYSSAIQAHNTGVIDVTTGLNVGSGTSIAGQVVTTNNLHARDIKISSILANRIPITQANDSIGSSTNLRFGAHTSTYLANNGLHVGYNPLLDSGNFRWSVDHASGKMTNFGGFKIGRANNIPTGQYSFTYPNTFPLKHRDHHMGDSSVNVYGHNRDFYGLELTSDSGALISTAYRNEMRAPVTSGSPRAGEKSVLNIKGLHDSALFDVFSDGTINFAGTLQKGGAPFAGGGIFVKDSDTQNAQYQPSADLVSANPYGIGHIAISEPNTNTNNHVIGSFVSKPEIANPGGWTTNANVIQREKYRFSVDGTFAVRGQIDSSSTDYVINPGSVLNWTDPQDGATKKVNFADDSDASRMMFIPSKAIFRAGFLMDSSQRGADMGMFSTGMGYNPVAQGNHSIAIGNSPRARSDHSIAIGWGDVGYENNHKAIAIGYNARLNWINKSGASQNAVIIGTNSKGGGNYGITLGNRNNASGDYTVVIGNLNEIGHYESAGDIDPETSSARGTRLDGDADNVGVLGYSNLVDKNADGSYVIGSNNRITSRASASFTLGTNNYVNKNSAIAIGTSHTLNARNSFAIGTNGLVDSAADYSGIIHLSSETSGRAVSSPNILSIRGGNLILGDKQEHFSASEYIDSGNLYVKGSIIVGGNILSEGAPGVTSSTTPFTDDGMNVVSNLSGTARHYGFGTAAPYQTGVFQGEYGLVTTGTVLTPNTTGASGYWINPFPYTNDENGDPYIANANVDSAFFDSTLSHNSIFAYIPRGGVFRAGTYSGGSVYDTYLRPGVMGFQSNTIGHNNVNAGFRTTVIGKGNTILRGGGPKQDALGTPIQGDSNNPASLRAADMIVIGRSNVFDSYSTGKEMIVLGDNNIIKGAVSNKIMIGSYTKIQPNSGLADGASGYDREIVLRHADSFGQDSLNNTHVAIGKYGVGMYGETPHESRHWALDVRGDIHLDSGATIWIGDPSSVTHRDGTTGKGVKSLQSFLGFAGEDDPTVKQTRKSEVKSENIGGGIAAITFGGSPNRIVVTTSGAHGLSNNAARAVRINGVATSGNGVSGLEDGGVPRLFNYQVIDTTNFYLVDSPGFTGATPITLTSGAAYTDEDGVSNTVTKLGSGPSAGGTVDLHFYQRPYNLLSPLEVRGDLTVGGEGANFRVDSLGLGFTAAGDGSLETNTTMAYNFDNQGLHITGTSPLSKYITIGGDSIEKWLLRSGGHFDSDLEAKIDSDYIQARVTADEQWTAHADALYYKPGGGIKPVQIGLLNSETTATERANYALNIAPLSGNGVINIKDPSATINADTVSPIQINGVNWPTDNYVKSIIDQTYIQSNVEVDNSTITAVVDQAYVRSHIDSAYVRARVKDSDEWQTVGNKVFVAHLPNTSDVMVGIGTANPTSKLEVAGHIKGDSGTFEGPMLIQGHRRDVTAEFEFTVNETTTFLNDDANNINANTTILDGTGSGTTIQSRIAAAGSGDSDFTVDLGGQPDQRHFKVYKINSAGATVQFGKPGWGVGGITRPAATPLADPTITSDAWCFDSINPRYIRLKKFAFDSDGSGNIVDQKLHLRDRRLQTTITLTGADRDGNTLAFNNNFAQILRYDSNDVLIDSDVAGSTFSGGNTVAITSATANAGHAFNTLGKFSYAGDSIEINDYFKILARENMQISNLVVHGPTTFTGGHSLASDSAPNKSGLVTFKDSVIFETLTKFQDSVDIDLDQKVKDNKNLFIDGVLRFDSDLAATINPAPQGGGSGVGEGGMEPGNMARTDPNHPKAPQNRFQMFRAVKAPGGTNIVERKLMSFDSNVMVVVDSALVGSRLDTSTQWNFATDARNVNTLSYQSNGAVVIQGTGTSLHYDIGGGEFISDSDTSLQVDSGNVIFKQGASDWDGVDGTTTFGRIPPIGAGPRFMWIPQRAALRAGAIDASAGKGPNGTTQSATSWSDTQVGQGSIALGPNADAKNYSVAIGTKTRAGFLQYTDENDHALRAVQHNHEKSVAIGYDVFNPAKQSVAIGSQIVHSSEVTGNAVGQYNTSIGYNITNNQRAETIAIGAGVSAYAGIAIGRNGTATTNHANNQSPVAIGSNVQTSGNAVGLGVDITGTRGGVAVGTSNTSANYNSVGVGINASAGTGSSVAVGTTSTASTSSISIGKTASSSRSGVAIGSATGASTNSVSLGVSNAANHSSSVAIGIDNTTSTSAIAIGKSNSGSLSSIAVGKGNRNLTYSAVAVGIDNYDNSRGAVLLGTSNHSNSGFYGSAVIVGQGNDNNGKNGGANGNGEIVVFGTENKNNFSGIIVGKNNTNINRTYVFGADNSDITKGDWGYIFGTGGSIIKKQTSSSVMGGMQYGKDNITYDGGYVYGTTNTGRHGGYAFGAGNYSYLGGYGFGYDNTLQGDSNPIGTTEYPLTFGRDNTATNGGIAFGENNTVSGTGQALGGNNTSTGSRSLAIGAGMNVSGTNSIGIGLNNTFSGNLTANNTLAITGGRVGIGTVTPSSSYLLEVDGGHVNVKGPYDYYRQGVVLSTYITSDVVHRSYIRDHVDSDHIRTAVDEANFYNPLLYWNRDVGTGNIQYTGQNKVGIGTAPRPVTGYANPVLDVKGGINFEGGLYLSGTRIVPSIDSINAVYISHQTLNYNIGAESAFDYFDSDYVFNRISKQDSDGSGGIFRRAFGFKQNDSVGNVIDASYINARVDASSFLDSGEALALVEEQLIDPNLPFRFNNTTGQVQLTNTEIANAGRPNLYGVRVGIGIAPDQDQTLRVGGDGTNAMEINNGILKLTGTNAKILIEKGGVLTEISDVHFVSDGATGNIRYDGGKDVAINLGAGNPAGAALDVGGYINAASGLKIGGADLLTSIITEAWLEEKLHNTFLDSALTDQMVDSAFVRLRADSDYVKQAADSAFLKQTHYLDNEKLFFSTNPASGLGTTDRNFISHTGGASGVFQLYQRDSQTLRFQGDSSLLIRGPEIQLSHAGDGTADRIALYTSDSGVAINGKLNRHSIPGGTGTIALADPTMVGGSAVIDSAFVRFRADSAYILTAADSAYILTAADSDYIKTAANLAHIRSQADSAYIRTAVDSNYIQSAVTGDFTKAIIDSDYIDSVTGIGLRHIDFNQHQIYYKNSVANTSELPNVAHNEGNTFVRRDTYKAYTAANGSWNQLAFMADVDSAYVLSAGKNHGVIDSAYFGSTKINTFAHGGLMQSAEYVVHLEDSGSQHSQVSKLVMTYNKTTAFVAEYGNISSKAADSSLGTFDASESSGDIVLTMNKAANTGKMIYRIQRTIV